MDWRILVAGLVIVTGASVGYLTDGTLYWIGVGIAIFGIGAVADWLIDKYIYNI